MCASAAARGALVYGRECIMGTYREHVLRTPVRRNIVVFDVSCRSKQPATMTRGFDKALALQRLSGSQRMGGRPPALADARSVLKSLLSVCGARGCPAGPFFPS